MTVVTFEQAVDLADIQPFTHVNCTKGVLFYIGLDGIAVCNHRAGALERRDEFTIIPLDCATAKWLTSYGQYGVYELARPQLVELDLYAENGYKDRTHYLNSLAEEYKVDTDVVWTLATALGQDSDFDLLVHELNELV